MKILRSADANTLTKPDGTTVSYYLFDDYEIMHNFLPPHTSQTWHHHEIIGETTFIIDGRLTAQWREDGLEKTEELSAGDLIESGTSVHTFTNNTDTVVRFMTLKRVPAGKNYRETFKSDKILD